MMFQSGYQRHVYSGFEPSQAFDVVYGGNFEHRLLSSIHSTMDHQRLTLGDMRLETGTYDFPVIAQGTMPKQEICIGFMARGWHLTKCNTMALAKDEVQIYPAGVELLYHASGSSRWVVLALPEERLQVESIKRMGRELDLARHAAYSLRLRAGGTNTLTNLTDDAFSLAHRLAPAGGVSPELGVAIYESLASGYIDALFDSESLHRSEKSATEIRHHRLIAACERLVLSGIESDIVLTEIAQRSGYSLRALELIFRRSVGMTPGRWFMTARLNGALRDLLACEESSTVSTIAMKWGFRHISRFAQYYREAFGELPSETLKRSQALQRSDSKQRRPAMAPAQFPL